MISAVENAATNIPPGLPNAPIAQGALFVVKGKNLGPANIVIASAFPLLPSIGGTSIKVTVGGTTVDAIMYYSLATQIAAILPSKTPAGTGTLTVTYNGLVSATAPIVVVANNIGMFTLNSTGAGDAVASLPATNTFVTPSNAPNPGEIVTFWGTGLGALPGDESQPAQQADMTDIPLKVFIGGQAAPVLFRGRNGCCSGVDSIYVMVPEGLTGCANSVIMQIGNLVSNATSIPIGTQGRNCVPIAPNQAAGAPRAGNPCVRRVVLSPSVYDCFCFRASSGTDHQNGYHRWRVRKGYNIRQHSSGLGDRYRFVRFLRGEYAREWAARDINADGTVSGCWSHHRKRPGHQRKPPDRKSDGRRISSLQPRSG